MAAQDTLAKVYAQMAMYHPQERIEIEELVAKLEKVCEHYSTSAELAICIVGLKISAARGQ